MKNNEIRWLRQEFVIDSFWMLVKPHHHHTTIVRYEKCQISHFKASIVIKNVNHFTNMHKAFDGVLCMDRICNFITCQKILLPSFLLKQEILDLFKGSFTRVTSSLSCWKCGRQMTADLMRAL